MQILNFHDDEGLHCHMSMTAIYIIIITKHVLVLAEYIYRLRPLLEYSMFFIPLKDGYL